MSQKGEPPPATKAALLQQMLAHGQSACQESARLRRLSQTVWGALFLRAKSSRREPAPSPPTPKGSGFSILRDAASLPRVPPPRQVQAAEVMKVKKCALYKILCYILLYCSIWSIIVIIV